MATLNQSQRVDEGGRPSRGFAGCSMLDDRLSQVANRESQIGIEKERPEVLGNTKQESKLLKTKMAMTGDKERARLRLAEMRARRK